MTITASQTFPAIGETFELTLSIKPNPLEFFKRYDLEINPWGDYDDFLPKKNNCEYIGKVIQTPITRRFQRIKIETEKIDHWKNLLNELTRYGSIPNGLWMEAYMAMENVALYHETEFLGIADNSWAYQFFGKFSDELITFFPCIGGGEQGWWRETLINPYLGRPFSPETTFSHIKEWLVEVRE